MFSSMKRSLGLDLRRPRSCRELCSSSSLVSSFRIVHQSRDDGYETIWYGDPTDISTQLKYNERRSLLLIAICTPKTSKVLMANAAKPCSHAKYAEGI